MISFDKIEGIEINSSASEADILNLSIRVPIQLKDILEITNGFRGDFVHFFSTEELEEMNEVFETEKYSPGYLMVASDGGDSAFVVKSSPNAELSVYQVGTGVMTEDCMVKISPSISEWIQKGARVSMMFNTRSFKFRS